ncbi:MAG: ATP-binding protein [Candidatus Omnitrophota bacterium]
MTDNKLKSGRRFLGFQRLDKSRKEWEPFPIPAFSERIQNSTLEVGVSYIGDRPEGRFVCHPSGQLVFSYFDKVYSYRPDSKTLDVILSATDTEMAKKFDWSMPAFSGEYRASLFGNNHFLGNIYLARDNGIWISSGGGAIKGYWDASQTSPRWTWKEYPFADELIQSTFYLYHLIERSDGTLYAKSFIHDATHSTGTQLLEFRENRWTKIVDQELTNTSFGWKDSQNRLWYSDYSQTIIQDGTKETAVFPILFWDVAFESDTRFFAGSDLGLVRYAEPLWSTPNALEDIDSGVNGIAEDDHGTIWISNFNRLISYRNNKIAVYEADPAYFGYVTGSENVLAFPNNQIAIELNTAVKSGVYLFDPAAKTFSPWLHPSEERLENFFSQNKKIWVTSFDVNSQQNKKVYRYDGESFITVLDLKQITSNRKLPLITSIIETDNGDLWMGLWHSFGPLLRRKNGETVLFDDRRTFPGTGGFKLLDIGNHRIWCAGANEVAEYDGSAWRIVKEGVDYAWDIIKDRQGRVWVAAKNGVHCYNPNQSNAWICYSVEDGLPINNAQRLYEDRQGNIWVGTLKGVSKFNPDSDASPPIVWMVQGKNSETITSDGNAQFVFEGIDKWKQTRKERLLYSYRIDDGNWSEFKSGNVAAFKAVAPGRHTFQVQAMDMNWNVSESPAIHAFQVLYPWYRDPKVMLIISISSILVLLFAGIAINRHRKLNKYSQRLEISNTQLNSMNAELQEANAQLIQLDQMKSAFVSQASHDLRTPLTAIKSSLDNVIRGVGGGLNEKQHNVLERALRSVDRLNHLINDVLDLNRIETGRVVLDKTDIVLGTLVKSILNENAPAATQKRIALLSSSLEDQQSIHVDVGKIERVVGELIGNAIKYTPEGGQVEVRLEKDKQHMILSVRDSGIGMTPEECGKIFDRFYRTHASQKMAKGSGLGLAIVKELIEMHGGKLAVKSQQNQGATFAMTLPIESA